MLITTYKRTQTGALTRSARLELADELRAVLIDTDYPTYNDQGQVLMHLSNSHFEPTGKLFDDLPSDYHVPYRYETPYPNYILIDGMRYHDPDPRPLGDDPLLVLWADGGIYPKE
jgi:hypothetical protein